MWNGLKSHHYRNGDSVLLILLTESMLIQSRLAFPPFPPLFTQACMWVTYVWMEMHTGHMWKSTFRSWFLVCALRDSLLEASASTMHTPGSATQQASGRFFCLCLPSHFRSAEITDAYYPIHQKQTKTINKHAFQVIRLAWLMLLSTEPFLCSLFVLNYNPQQPGQLDKSPLYSIHCPI